MIDVMSWQFWLMLHGTLTVLAVGLALCYKLRLTALLMCIGVVVGAVLAVVPIMIAMQWSTQETGYDAGNVGVFFCFTVPLFPLIGLGVGALIGRASQLKRSGPSE